VRVYAGPGASSRCVAYTVEALQSTLPGTLAVSTIEPQELLGKQKWERDTGAYRSHACVLPDSTYVSTNG
jgi:glutamine amidotransferase-like uncharacterized protein